MRHTILAFSGLLVFIIATADAQDQSVVVPPQLAPPVEAQPAQPVPSPRVTNEVESMPAPVMAMPAAVNPTPPISYHAGPRARRMLKCNPEVNLVMVAKNPIDCCLYEIPLCVPACCEGQPAMSEGRGLFGRGIVEYCWPCGFKATVKFRPVHCDVKVEYTVD